MIRKYENKDFKKIEEITRKCWSDEVEMSLELKQFIYNFLVKYYLYNNEYCLVNEDEKINAFLLANLKSEKNNSLEIFKKDVKNLSSNDQINAKIYLDYIEYNHQKVLKYMHNNDLYLGLLASVKKGTGSKLINKIKEIAIKNKIKNLYLWTDETCNYEYYEKHNFTFVEEYEIFLYDTKIKTLIYKVSL